MWKIFALGVFFSVFSLLPCTLWAANSLDTVWSNTFLSPVDFLSYVTKGSLNNIKRMGSFLNLCSLKYYFCWCCWAVVLTVIYALLQAYKCNECILESRSHLVFYHLWLIIRWLIWSMGETSQSILKFTCITFTYSYIAASEYTLAMLGKPKCAALGQRPGTTTWSSTYEMSAS